MKMAQTREWLGVTETEIAASEVGIAMSEIYIPVSKSNWLTKEICN